VRSTDPGTGLETAGEGPSGIAADVGGYVVRRPGHDRCGAGSGSVDLCPDLTHD